MSGFAGGPGWGAPPARPLAAADRVHVWAIPIAVDAATLAGCAEQLAPGELARARRLRVGGARFTAARAALRRVLARYLGTPPERIEFGEQPQGRLVLAGSGAALRFNLAHADDLALVAVRRGLDVGVDVERVRDDVDGAAVAAALFSPRERAWLGALGAANAHEAFFHAWVRKEAVAKANGRGIACAADAGEAAGLVVRALPGPPGHAAAVASPGRLWTATCWYAGLEAAGYLAARVESTYCQSSQTRSAGIP